MPLMLQVASQRNWDYPDGDLPLSCRPETCRDRAKATAPSALGLMLKPKRVL
jgi:hypothetical protein